MKPKAKTVTPQDIEPFRWDADLHNAFLDCVGCAEEPNAKTRSAFRPCDRYWRVTVALPGISFPLNRGSHGY